MKRKISALPAIIIRITAIALTFWLGMMCLITYGCIRDVNAQLEQELYVLDPDAAPYDKITNLASSITRPMPELNFPLAKEPASRAEIYENPVFGYDSAHLCRTEQGRTVKNGAYYYFHYFEESQWGLSMGERFSGRTAIDLSSFPEGVALAQKIGTNVTDGYWLNVRTVRFTGYFEDEWFIPVTMDEGGSGADIWPREKPKNWENIFTRQVETDQELITIYVDVLGGVNFADRPVTVDGVHYDSLTDALDDYIKSGGANKKISAGIVNTVVMRAYRTKTEDGLQVVSARANRINPLMYCVSVLWPVYVVTLVVLLAMVTLLILKIQRELTEPVRQVNLLAAGLPVPSGKSYEPRWKEPYEAEVHFARMDQQLRELKAHNRQLQTALDYAKDAESYRRRMISGLTHELKTPLAVIHSYAEGLKEGIAKEKTEQYLDVILQESEWMDAMVLQMLDLSRLEAGKVRLSTEQFSLSELTRSVFDKLMPLAEEKELTVEFNMVSDCVITADESRIRQVVTNLASNAIKYTPAGGKIVVIAYQKKGEHYLSVENTCQRLSEEALTRVWDSFYRGDAARTTEGTGLGLTVVKTIVELHGGTCRVFNTPTGVQFQIILP